MKRCTGKRKRHHFVSNYKKSWKQTKKPTKRKNVKEKKICRKKKPTKIFLRFIYWCKMEPVKQSKEERRAKKQNVRQFFFSGSNAIKMFHWDEVQKVASSASIYLCTHKRMNEIWRESKRRSKKERESRKNGFERFCALTLSNWLCQMLFAVTHFIELMFSCEISI